MGFLSKILGRKEKEQGEIISIQTPRGPLTIQTEDFLEKDPDTRIEEFWVETMDVSEDGYWLIVGRRHGVIQLYDWSGRLHRLPSRPPAQVITEALLRGPYLSLITPPYLVVYQMENSRNPQTWKSFRTTQEGIRASVGLDISGNLLAYGVVGERVYVIDIAGGFGSEGLDFKSAFSYSSAEIGELRLLKFIGNNRLILSGTKGVALYDLGGNLLKKLPHPSGKAAKVFKRGVILSDEKRLLLYDLQLDECLHVLEVPMPVSQMDLSPDGELLFMADPEENRLGVLYLPEMQFLRVVEGLGYSVLRVSPDGTLYTCTFRDEEDRRFYTLRAFSTNMVDFLYDRDRQAQMVRRAEEELKKLKNRLRKLDPEADPSEVEEYRRILSMDAPLRRLREVVLQAERAVEDARFEAFVRRMEEKLRKEELSGEDLREVENRIRLETGERQHRLLQLKESIHDHLKRRLEEHLQSVRKAIEGVDAEDLRELEAFEDVKRAREFLSRLPGDLREEGHTQLSRLLQTKLLENRLGKYRIRIEDSKVIFGSEDFPRFSGERRKLRWRLKVEDRLFVGGGFYTRLVFEREDGVVVEPKRYSNLLPEESVRSLPKWVRRYLRHLNGLYGQESVKRPLFVSYEETPWFVKNLQKFVSILKEQLLYSEGILILEGDAGVGKNFLVEVFSALTGRPLYIVSCNAKLEKEDVTFVYEFDPKRGTKRVYSDLVKALQTPGAVVYFDEINTLPHGLVKLFNPLFDYRRYLALPTGEVIRAHRDVLLVGGMNPQNYLGVSELPQDIKSRADIVFIDYPPFEDSVGMYSPDEALILKDQIPELSSLSSEDFLFLWHWVINGLRVKNPDGLEKYEGLIWKVFELIKIANAVRKAYRAYQTQQSEEPVEFVFSIRDTIRCARRLGRYASVKELVMDTVIPKVSSALEKEILKSLIQRV